MNIHTVYGFFMRGFRPRRAAIIARSFPFLACRTSRVLDVGGGLFPWEIIQPIASITILNVALPKNIPKNCPWTFIQGDGTCLKFSDGEFDLAFSSSVIEHVGSWETQKKFASEMLRCGKQIYLQTPNKWFFIEPHLLAPLLHWLPVSIARRLIRYCSIWGWVTKPNQEKIDTFLRETRLLSESEVRECFPDCKIHKERFLGMTKSFIVMT